MVACPGPVTASRTGRHAGAGMMLTVSSLVGRRRSPPPTRLPRTSRERTSLSRKREAGVQLPEGVEKSVRKKKNGKVYTYYYWNPGRSTKRQKDRIKLPDPE